MKRQLCRCPLCGAKVRNRATYCSQTCRRASESGTSRADQLAIEAERLDWTVGQYILRTDGWNQSIA